MLQSLNYLSSLSLYSLQYVHVSPVLESPELNTSLTSVEQTGRTTSNLLETLLLMQTSRLLATSAMRMHSRLKVDLLPIRILRAFSAKLLYSW